MVKGEFRPKRHKEMVYTAKKMYEALRQHTQIEWEWVKGHAGHEFNEMADALAGSAKNDGAQVGGRVSLPTILTPATLPTVSTPPNSQSRCVQDQYDKLAAALWLAEEATYNPQTRAPKQQWFSPELAEQIHQAKILRQQHDPDAAARYKAVKSQARKAKREWIRDNLVQENRASLTHTTLASS